MSIGSDIAAHFNDEVSTTRVTKSIKLHGENAINVIVGLKDGRTVTGTFTTESRDSFGGVTFSQQKDVAGLMIAKIESVLRGTHERS